MSFLAFAQSVFLRLRSWTQHHGGEALWAAVFAVVFGLPLAVYFAEYVIDLPPYTIYVVAGSHYLTKSKNPALDTKKQFESLLPRLKVANVDVNLVVVELPNDKPETVTSEAKFLAAQPDTLLIIGHLDSQPTEAALPTYFEARPQVPFIASVQTDDNLLKNACVVPRNVACYDGTNPLPYLQLSPTNLEQARWAVRFATEREKHNFLIVESDGPDEANSAYSKSLASDYSQAVIEFNDDTASRNTAGGKSTPRAEVLTANLVWDTLADDALWDKFRDAEVDCLLYAGGFDGAGPLLKLIAELKKKHLNDVDAPTARRPLMVILDDSVVEQRLSGTKFELSPVHITDQADAEDYNSGLSVYGLDAIAIAGQLINDLNRRGFDWRFRIKALFHLQSGKDARRNLVSVMQENFIHRSSYFGSDQTGITPESPNVYAFNGYTRVNGMFHVWQRTGLESEDVDRWHPLKKVMQRRATSGGPNDQVKLKASISEPKP
jgi:hypothetical protein